MSEDEAVAVLVLRARSGDADAVRQLYLRFSHAVHGVLLGYLQPADADDLTHDVFEIALRQLHDLREPAAFPGWLLSIARHAALQRLRHVPPERSISSRAQPATACFSYWLRRGLRRG